MLSRLKQLPKALPELIAIALICYQSSLFNYLPLTDDDLLYATEGFPSYVWRTENRPGYLIVSSMIETVNRWVLNERWIHGTHIFAFYLPLVVLYIWLRNLGLRHAGLGMIALSLSLQIYGYEHTNPLSYPISWSVSLALSLAAALLASQSLINKRSHVQTIGWTLIGILGCCIYEPFSVVFSITFGANYLARSKSYNTLTKGNSGQQLTTNLAVSAWALSPLAATIMSKLILSLVNHFVPNVFFESLHFGEYQGTQFDLTTPLLSLRTSINHIVGDTILTHIGKPLVWDAAIKTYPTASTRVIAFYTSGCSYIAAYSVNLLRDAKPQRSSDYRIKSLKSLSLLLSAGFTCSALAITLAAGLTRKYHQWFALSDYSWEHTYLTGSLATVFAFAAASCFFFGLTPRQLDSKQALIIIAIISSITTVFGTKTISHNLFISELIKKNAKTFDQYIFQCRAGKTIDPELALKVSKDHPGLASLDKLCLKAHSSPNLLKHWGLSQ